MGGNAVAVHDIEHAFFGTSLGVSLETGSQPAFAPARALYARFGFLPCGPFGAYVEDPNSSFMTRVL